MGVSKIEYIIGLILAPLFLGWVFVGIGVGFKFLKRSLGKRLANKFFIKNNVNRIVLFLFYTYHRYDRIPFKSNSQLGIARQIKERNSRIKPKIAL